MKFSINRALLINIFTDYLSILRDHPVKPVIAGLNVRASSDHILFVGTNLEVNLVKRIPATILEEGEAVFIPNLVLEYIKLLDEEEIEISLKDNRLVIQNADFAILDSDDFPLITQIEEETLTTIKGKEFVEYLDKVKFSTSLNNDNLAISCVRLAFLEREINFVSTDSYRLTFVRKPHTCKKEIEISLPTETVLILCKLLKNSDEDIAISIMENTIVFKWENSYFSSRIIELPFPNYKGILGNSNFQKIMEFNASELKSALKKVMTVAKTNVDSKFGALFDFKENMLVISSSGKAKISQKVPMIKEGENFRASLNTKFLYDFIDSSSKNIIIRGNSSSAMFEVRELKNDDYIYILMPLALRD